MQPPLASARNDGTSFEMASVEFRIGFSALRNSWLRKPLDSLILMPPVFVARFSHLVGHIAGSIADGGATEGKGGVNRGIGGLCCTSARRKSFVA